MDREQDKRDNGSYFYRLNQELSGQPGITPYFVDMGTTVMAGEGSESQLKGSSDDEQPLS